MKQKQNPLKRKESRSFSNLPAGKRSATPVPSLHQGQIVASKYRLIEKLGQGSFGCIFRSVNLESNELCATKFEKRGSQSAVSLLMREIKVLLEIAGQVRYPIFHTLQARLPPHFLLRPRRALQLFNDHSPRQQPRAALPQVQLQVLLHHRPQTRSSNARENRKQSQHHHSIQAFHHKNLIHRDIKPENYTIANDDITYLYMIDFGLSKYYRDPTSGKHIPNADKKGLIGTARYASANAHQGKEQCRKDDLISIGYTLIYLSTAKLPWANISADKKEEKYRLIMEKKLSLSHEELCSNLPKCYTQYFHLISQLQFTETPNYQKLKQLFEHELANQILCGEKVSKRLDWEKLPEYRKNMKENQTSVRKSQEKERIRLFYLFHMVSKPHLQRQLQKKAKKHIKQIKLTRKAHFCNFLSQCSNLGIVTRMISQTRKT